VQGHTNKTIAYELQITSKTVDFHRLNVLHKMGVKTLITLVLLMQKMPTD